VLPIAVQGFPRFLAVFRSLYLFIPRFLAELLTLFHGQLFGKNWSGVGNRTVTDILISYFRILKGDNKRLSRLVVASSFEQWGPEYTASYAKKR